MTHKRLIGGAFIVAAVIVLAVVAVIVVVIDDVRNPPEARSGCAGGERVRHRSDQELMLAA
ncbi:MULTISPECIES: hypothetical protein [Glycomyces]|uniref:Uncharacterized protein n=2 Tax=Glycomyces TaxID=58113 RepID=A0A9X3SVW3_9ACTN|nr:hypothetical protein [Glycomyces lechevalierae]MDA1386429.1 hypothetical protein [Glycomyces lechevalierae]MDR7338945.1 hypothetical protein [Glycomyces lechevalierae]